jgi:phage-related protein
MDTKTYENVPREYAISIATYDRIAFSEKMAKVVEWLHSASGYARLEDSFETDVFRLAYYSGGDDVENLLMQAGEATLRFTCRAERFLKEGEQTIIVSNGSKIYNPTRFESKPLVHIEGDGEIMLSIGGARITATVDEYINIDSDTMNAYKEPTNNENDKITGSFPTIKPGENAISITGDFTAASIVPRYFTI